MMGNNYIKNKSTLSIDDIKKNEVINDQCSEIVKQLQSKGWTRPRISEYVLGKSKGIITHRLTGNSNFKRTDIQQLMKALKYDSFENYVISKNKIC